MPDTMMMDSSHSTAEGQRPRPAVGTRHILLIEDNKADVTLIKRMLRDVMQDDEFDFTDVPRMAEAMALLDKQHFALILLDLNLLDMEGPAAVSALHAEAPNIPIIVYSGTNDQQTKENALTCGARHYLVKGHESPYSLKFMIQETLQTKA